MNPRKIPESPLSPDFIKVAYDKHGNPIAVTPVDMKADENTQQPQTNGHVRIIPQPIEEWLSLISKNIIALKRDVENTQSTYSQIVQQIRQINTPQNDIARLRNGIDTANQRIDMLAQKMSFTNQHMSEQINILNSVVASIAKEFAEHQTIDKDVARNIAILNEQFNGNFVNIKRILQDIELLNSGYAQRLDMIDERINAMHIQIAESVERTEGNIVALNDAINELKNKIDNMENSNFDKKIEISNSLNVFKQEIMEAIEQNKIDRDTLISEVVERTAKRMRKIMTPKVDVKFKVKKRKARKPKKIVKGRKNRKIRVTKKIAKRMSKINKTILAKKLLRADVPSYPSVLIVTERRMQKVGRAVFDAAKNLNKNVLMIVQDKMSESDGFEEVTYDAMSNSDAIFVVTRKKMKKNFSLKTLERKPIFIVNQKMKFSKVSN